MNTDWLLLETPSEKLGQSKKKRLNTAERKILAASLARLLQGGITLLKAIQILRESSSQTRLKIILDPIEEGLRAGQSFSSALENAGSVFDGDFIQMIKAGEEAGRLAQVLFEIAGYLEREEKALRKMREALAYPAFVLLMGFVTWGILIGMVLPKLAEVYSSFDQELPALTRMILGLKYFAALFFVLPFVCLAGWKNLKLRQAFQAWLLSLPWIQQVFKKWMLARFSRLISLLLESGIPVLPAMTMSRSAVNSEIFRQDLDSACRGIREGASFSSSLKDAEWIDGLSRAEILAGEESGNLSEALSRVSFEAESELEASITWAGKILEPVLILAVGLGAGILAAGAMLPVFNLHGAL